MNDDLISRSALMKVIKTECNPYGKPTIDFESGKKVLRLIDNAPTVEERPQGEWINIDKYNPYYALLRCSFCGDATKEDKYEGDYWSPNYCPWCGADMQGEEE